MKKTAVWLIPAVIGAIVCLAWVGLTGQFAPIVTVGINQDRLNISAPRPDETTTLTQTFTSPQSGLSAVEIRFAKRAYDSKDNGIVTLTVRNAAGAIIAQEQLQTAPIQHNDIHEIAFLPQAQSAGQTYTLTIAAVANPATTIWGYGLDAITPGAFSGAESKIADLRLITRHTLTWAAVWAETAALGRNHAPLLIALLLILPAPALLSRFPFPLAFCLWAIVWLWGSLLISFPAWLLSVLVIGSWWLAASRWRRTPSSLPLHPSSFILLSLLLISFFTRFFAIRTLAFPPWVDSSHHALITQVMVTTGRMITDYAPIINIERPLYHTGFYALPTTIIRMIGSDLPQTLLVLGQLISSLIPLTVYKGAVMISKRRGVGLLAAFLVALPFFFPGFYISWGRITQLAGMLIMPVLLGLTWQTAAQDPDKKRSNAIVIGVLAAGLFLIHTRVFLLYVPYTAVVWIGHRLRGTVDLVLAGLVAFVLALPRIIQLAALTDPADLTREIPNYNNVPTAYLDVGWERGFAYAAAVALLLAVGARLWRWVRRDAVPHPGQAWYTPIFMISFWVALLFGLLLGRQVNLPIPSTWVVNVNSMYITLFLPVAWVIAMAAAAIWDGVRRLPMVGRFVFYALFGAGMAYMGVFGVRQQITILNNRTILAHAADRTAIDWMADNLAADVLIANGTWKWLGNTYAANDGSAWIVPLSGRMTTTPPNDYIYGRAWQKSVPAFNEAAIAVENWAEKGAAELLRSFGVTHVYVGQRGSFFVPEQLLDNAQMRLLYAYDGAFVFALITR